ncbi:MAG: VOC family protein [Pyrinomonadaceae bacterium]
MSDHTVPANGTFCWNELATSNAEACKNFYTQLFGWTPNETNVGDTPYTTFKVGGREIGGMMQMTAEWGNTPPHWMPYVAVDDVDATAKRVEELGGKVCVPPTDIPTVGRFAVLGDPSGAAISVIRLAGAQS